MRLELRLPFPPSENSYRRAIRMGKSARVIISVKGREYREEVIRLVTHLRQSQPIPTFTTPVKVRYTFHRGDRRKYDIGNFIKALDDSLEAAKVYADDALIHDQRLIKGEVNPRDGFVFIQIKTL